MQVAFLYDARFVTTMQHAFCDYDAYPVEIILNHLIRRDKFNLAKLILCGTMEPYDVRAARRWRFYFRY
jgi:hypothetical protein